MINYFDGIGLSSVAAIIVLLYLLLVLLRRHLLEKSRKDHAFGESLLSELEPTMVKVKLV
jgi:hypothetical protein